MRQTLAIVLAGGEGQRLAPLTRERSKPAVFFGGVRLVDFVLSNLVNSGVRHIKVVTQYRSTSLVRHLARAWPTMANLGSYEVDAVPAAMNLGPSWFKGTADAIWQNLDLLREHRPTDVCVFSSDHVYKMDVSEMLSEHRRNEAAVTVAVTEVPRSEAHAFGCVDVDETGKVIGFLEKPSDPPAMPGKPDTTLVSMGNYVFRTPVLLDELRRCMNEPGTRYDFGRDILASCHERMSVRAYNFSNHLCPGESEHARGYWRDVGTLDAYHQASMDLVSVHPQLDLYNDEWPIRGQQSGHGPAKFVFADKDKQRVGTAIDSIVGSGSIISGAHLERTVCFEKVRVHSYAQVTDSVVFPRAEIGRNCRLRRCIIDKGVKVPPGTIIGEDLEADRARFTVSDEGVVVVERAAFGQTDEFDIGRQELLQPVR